MRYISISKFTIMSSTVINDADTPPLSRHVENVSDKPNGPGQN